MDRSYSNLPVLSKMKIGNTYYYLKDADVRGLLNSIDDDIWAGLLVGFGTIGDPKDNNKFVNAAEVKRYVDEQAAVAFDLVVLDELPAANESSWNTYHNSIVLIPKGSAQTQNAKDEYIIVRSGAVGSYTYAWEKIGDTEIDLSGYVTDISYETVSHTLKQTKGTVTTTIHEFGDFADADQGEFTVNDYVTGVSSAKVTAEGSISGAIVKDDSNGVTISGTVSKPNVNVTVTTATIAIIDSVGSAPSLSTASYNLYEQGIVATVGSSGDDAECLIFSNAGLAATFNGVSSWSAGAAPTTKTQTILSTVSAELASAPQFTGDRFAFAGSFSGTQVDASITLSTGTKTVTVNPK